LIPLKTNPGVNVSKKLKKISCYKKIFSTLLIVMLTSTSVQAAWDHQQGLCVTSPYPSTTFAFVTDKADDGAKIVKLSVIHHNGLAYAPFWETAIVPSDLKMLSEKSKVILSLDEQLNTSWPEKSCRWIGAQKLACIGSAEKIVVNKKLIEPWAFYSTVLSESSFAGDFTYIQMTLIFYVDGEKFIYTSKYSQADCDFNVKTLFKKKLWSVN
jgi:hypothetical protein